MVEPGLRACRRRRTRARARPAPLGFGDVLTVGGGDRRTTSCPDARGGTRPGLPYARTRTAARSSPSGSPCRIRATRRAAEQGRLDERQIARQHDTASTAAPTPTRVARTPRAKRRAGPSRPGLRGPRAGRHARPDPITGSHTAEHARRRAASVSPSHEHRLVGSHAPAGAAREQQRGSAVRGQPSRSSIEYPTTVQPFARLSSTSLCTLPSAVDTRVTTMAVCWWRRTCRRRCSRPAGPARFRVAARFAAMNWSRRRPSRSSGPERSYSRPKSSSSHARS